MNTAAKRPPSRQIQTQWQRHVAPHWQALSSRERLSVGVAAVALSILLVWFVAIAPALKTLREVPAQRATLDVQLAQMQRQAADAARLRALPPLPLAQAQTALNAATDRLGGKARLALTGDRATVTFTGIEGPALLAWLGEVRSGARARPIEAQLKRLGRAYDGTVTLGLAGAQEPR